FFQNSKGNSSSRSRRSTSSINSVFAKRMPSLRNAACSSDQAKSKAAFPSICSTATFFMIDDYLLNLYEVLSDGTLALSICSGFSCTAGGPAGLGAAPFGFTPEPLGFEDCAPGCTDSERHGKRRGFPPGNLMRAGTPMIVVLSGTSLMITLLATITTLFPMRA